MRAARQYSPAFIFITGNHKGLPCVPRAKISRNTYHSRLILPIRGNRNTSVNQSLESISNARFTVLIEHYPTLKPEFTKLAIRYAPGRTNSSLSLSLRARDDPCPLFSPPLHFLRRYRVLHALRDRFAHFHPSPRSNVPFRSPFRPLFLFPFFLPPLFSPPSLPLPPSSPVPPPFSRSHLLFTAQFLSPAPASSPPAFLLQ